MVAGPRRLVRWRSDSSRIAATVCANRQPVDLWTTLRVAHKAHSRNNSSNSAEQNGKCVTHVAGLKCYLCRRLLRGEGARKFQKKIAASEPPHPRSRSLSSGGALRRPVGSLDLSPPGRGERCAAVIARSQRVRPEVAGPMTSSATK